MNRTNVFIDQIAEAFCEMTRATHEQQAELVNAMRTIALHAVAEDENIRVISLRRRSAESCSDTTRQ